MKMYGVLMRVIGEPAILLAEGVYGAHVRRSPALIPTKEEAEQLLGWYKKADWAVNAAGRSYYGRDVVRPVRWYIVEIDVPEDFLAD